MTLDDLTKAYETDDHEVQLEEEAAAEHVPEEHVAKEHADEDPGRHGDGYFRPVDWAHEAVMGDGTEKPDPEKTTFNKLLEDWTVEERRLLDRELGDHPPVDALRHVAGVLGDKPVNFPNENSPEAMRAWMAEHMQNAPFGDHTAFEDALQKVIQHHFVTNAWKASPRVDAAASVPHGPGTAHTDGAAHIDEPSPSLDRSSPRSEEPRAAGKGDKDNVYRLEEVDIGRDKRTIPGPDDIAYAQAQMMPQAPTLVRPGMGGGYPGGGSGGGGAGVGLGTVFGSAIGSVLGFATTTTMAASRSMSNRIAAYLDRHNGPAPALVNPVEHAESMIVEAELASNRVIKAAQTLREHPAMASFVEEFDALARPEGKLIPDVIRHMKPGGKQETLWDRFQTTMAGDSSFAEAHKSLAKEVAGHEAAWAGATDAVAAAKGAPDQLWARFDRATTDVRAATQDLPAEPGKSFADLARGIVEKLQTAFARVFRLAPSRSGASPSMSAT